MLGLGHKAPLSHEEKIDAIYGMLRRAERRRRIALAVRLALVAAVAFAAFSFVTNPNSQAFAESLFERYMLPRLTDMAERMARKMQANLLDGSSSSMDEIDNLDNVDNPDGAPSPEAGLSPEARALLRRFSNLDRARAAEVADRLPPGTLESMGLTREGFVSLFPQ